MRNVNLLVVGSFLSFVGCSAPFQAPDPELQATPAGSSSSATSEGGGGAAPETGGGGSAGAAPTTTQTSSGSSSSNGSASGQTSSSSSSSSTSGATSGQTSSSSSGSTSGAGAGGGSTSTSGDLGGSGGGGSDSGSSTTSSSSGGGTGGAAGASGSSTTSATGGGTGSTTSSDTTSSTGTTSSTTTTTTTTTSSTSTGCLATEKVCGGECVAKTDPAYGCANAACAACDLAHAAPTCASGVCAVASCDAGFADCDGDDASGCERATSADTGNCGACGNVCLFTNAGATCNAGACGLGACNALFGNCDGNPSNGCEKPLAADAANCGACGKSCGDVGNSCESGKCYIPCGQDKVPAAGVALCVTLNHDKHPAGTSVAAGGVIDQPTQPDVNVVPFSGCQSPNAGDTMGCNVGALEAQTSLLVTIKALGADKYAMCGPYGAAGVSLCNVDVFRVYKDGVRFVNCTGTGKGDGAGLPFCTYVVQGGETYIGGIKVM